MQINDLASPVSTQDAPPYNCIITLAQNHSFHSIQRDLETLYSHFCILSYMSKRCEISVNGRYHKYDSHIVEFETKLYAKRIFYLYQIRKHQFVPPTKFIKSKSSELSSHSHLQIEYFITDQLTLPQEAKKLTRIRCIFNLQIRKNIEYIHIEINEEERWFLKIFDLTGLDNRFDRIHDHRPLKPSEIQYPWLEQRTRRFKRIPGKHIALALQGGGVKGICYIGAIKAIRQELPNVEISSVIGSSAGGILCLAICCQLEEQQIVNLCVNYLSKVPTNDLKYKNGPALESYLIHQFGYKQTLKSFLLQYGIIDGKLYEILTQSIGDEQIQQAVIELLQQINPTFKELFSVPKSGNRRQLLLYGLLKGKILTGETIKQIAKVALILFQKKKSIKIPKYYNGDVMQWAEKLTLRQFYELSKVEFTCTSVDLQNHILRFFNHKTTPDLPVVESVVMTGSFPIAFQSRKWARSWGKYYVHYENTRKEIDLSGCEFTDGGMLANFPIKYLDNDKMRPMYFSHETVYRRQGSYDLDQSETILYGFGLNDIKEMSEANKTRISEKMKKLGTLVMDNISRRKVVGNLLYRLVTPTPVVNARQKTIEDLDKIPLIQMLKKLLITYTNTKDNLTKQCFATDICTSTIEPAILSMQSGTVSRQQAFLDGVQKLSRDCKRYFIDSINRNHDPLQIMTYNLDYMRRYIQNVNYLQSNVIFIEATINHLITTYLHFSSTLQARSLPELHSFHQKLQIKSLKIQESMRFSSIFINGYIKEDFSKLLFTINEDLIPFFSKIKANSHQTRYNNLSATEKAEVDFVKQTLDKIRDYEVNNFKNLFNNIQSLKRKVATQGQKGGLIVMEEDLMFSIFEIKKNILTTVHLSNIRLFIDEGIMGSKLPQLIIGYTNYDNKRQILSYIKKLITKQYQRRKNPGIHLILQPRKLSEIYFHQLLSLTQIAVNQLNEEFNLKKNEEKLYLQSMTGSDYHSVALFLHASDFSNGRITSQIWKIKDLISINPKIETQYDEKIWAQNNLQRVRQLQAYIWTHAYDIFKQIEIDFKNNGKFTSQQEFKEFFKRIFENNRNFIDEMNEGMETSLNYVIDCIANLEEKEDIQKKIAEIEHKLTINLGKNGEIAIQEFKLVSKQAAQLGAFFLDRYLGIVKYFLYFWHENVIFHLKQSERKQVWKGLIMGEALTGIKLKQFVLEKLQQLGLKPNTTLKEFYDLSKKKIHMNFLAVETPTNAITFLNHKTAPYMPVWAAILATSSHPLLFKPVANRAEWNYVPIQKYEERIVRQYFLNTPLNKNFQSADSLMKIPFELITNHRIKELITDHPHEIYICLNFQLTKEPQNKKSSLNSRSHLGLDQNTKKQIKKDIFNKPITIYDVIFNLSFSSAAFNLFLTIPAVSYRTNILSLFVNSHDNLITKIYGKELVKLPIRLGTLDFHEISDINGKPSNIFKNAVMQSYYVSLENIKNTNLSSNRRIMYFRIESPPTKQNEQITTSFSPRKILLTQLGSPRGHKKSREQTSPKINLYSTNKEQKIGNCVIRFLSFHETARSIIERCKIFYQTQNGTPYQQVTKESLDLKLNHQKSLNLEFVYPEVTISGDGRSSSTIKKILYDSEFENKVSSFRKEQRYLTINFRQFLTSISELRSKALNYGFIYCLQYNRYSQSMRIFPIQGEINRNKDIDLKKYPLTIRSFLKANQRQSKSSICDFCSRSSQSFYSSHHKNHKVFKVSCEKDEEHDHHHKLENGEKCAHCQVSDRHIVLRCECSAQYCVKCKYQPFVKNNQLVCPADHVLSKKKKTDLLNLLKKDAMQKQVKERMEKFNEQGKQYNLMKSSAIKQSAQRINSSFNNFHSMCELCENISSHDFYYDEQCGVLVCEACCLKIFSNT